MPGPFSRKSLGEYLAAKEKPATGTELVFEAFDSSSASITGIEALAMSLDTTGEWWRVVDNGLAILEKSWNVIMDRQIQNILLSISDENERKERLNELLLQKENAFLEWEASIKSHFWSKYSEFLAAKSTTQLIAMDSLKTFDMSQISNIITEASANSKNKEDWMLTVELGISAWTVNHAKAIDDEIQEKIDNFDAGGLSGIALIAHRTALSQILNNQKNESLVMWEAAAKAYLWQELEKFLQGKNSENPANTFTPEVFSTTAPSSGRIAEFAGLARTEAEYWNTVNRALETLTVSWYKDANRQIDFILTSITDEEEKLAKTGELTLQKNEAFAKWQSGFNAFIWDEYVTFLEAKISADTDTPSVVITPPTFENQGSLELQNVLEKITTTSSDLWWTTMDYGHSTQQSLWLDEVDRQSREIFSASFTDTFNDISLRIRQLANINDDTKAAVEKLAGDLENLTSNDESIRSIVAGINQLSNILYADLDTSFMEEMDSFADNLTTGADDLARQMEIAFGLWQAKANAKKWHEYTNSGCLATIF